MSTTSLLLTACLLLASASADDSHIGGQCTGDLLLSQNASTKTDSEESFVVAYGGDPGVQISCVTTQDLSPGNTPLLSTLLSGGPGKRYVVVEVSAEDGSDADFAVNIFGENPLQNRVKRDEPTSTSSVLEAADDLSKMSKQLRDIADRLEAIETVLRLTGQLTG